MDNTPEPESKSIANSASTVATAEQAHTPAQMILEAVKQGADLEKLKGLLELQERFDANEAKKAYHLAMTRFKADPPKINKDKSVSFGAGKTSYKHASLANVTDKISASLSRYGLSASWATKQNGEVSVTCRITHELGHSEETTLSAPSDSSGSKNSIQAIGSTITYLERYTLLALTGLATYEGDDDAVVLSQPITDAQLSTLVNLLAEKNIPLDVLEKAMKVDELSKLPSDKFETAKIAIKNSKARS